VTTQVESAERLPVGVDIVARPERGNSHGRMTALTLFSPIRKQWLHVLRVAMWAGKWVPFAQTHILQFNFIHYVRWAVVKEWPYNGPPQERDKLNYPYLFFESNFDGPWQKYIDAFAYCIPKDIRFVWGRGVNFPGPPPAEPLKRWIAANSMEGGTYYSAYPQASTRMMHGALAVRKELRKLVAESEALGPEEFKARYDRFLTDVQAHL
jgi:hypothetical protein